MGAPAPKFFNMAASRSETILTGIILTTLSAIGFGLLPFFTYHAKASGMNTWDCLAGRYLGSSLMMLAIIKVKGHRLAIERKTAIRVSAAGIFAFGMTSAFLLMGYTHAPTGKVTAIHFLYPAIVMLISIALGKEKLRMVSIFATAASLAGLMLITLPSGTERMDTLGFIFSACSSVTFAIYALSLDTHLMKALDNSVLVFYLSLSSGFFFLLIAVLTAMLNGHPAISAEAFMPMLGMVLVSSAMPASFFSLGTRKLGAPVSSILSMFEPVTAAVTGALFLGEKMSSSFALGLALIIAASTSISLSKMHAGKSSL